MATLFKDYHETPVSTVKNPAQTPARIFEPKFQEKRARHPEQPPPHGPQTPYPALRQHGRLAFRPFAFSPFQPHQVARRLRARQGPGATLGLRLPHRQCPAPPRRRRQPPGGGDKQRRSAMPWCATGRGDYCGKIFGCISMILAGGGSRSWWPGRRLLAWGFAEVERDFLRVLRQAHLEKAQA